MDHIVTYRQRVGDTEYISGDRIDLESALKKGLLNETVIKQLKDREEIVLATPETFRVAMARRAPDAPWPPRGFTQAYLEEKGLIEKAAAPAAAPAKKAAPKKPVPKKAEPVTAVTLTDEKIAVGPYFLQPSKRGNFTFYTAADAEGRVLRAQLFKNIQDGKAFLEGLSTASPAPDTQGQEAADGSDVRHQPEPAEGSDPPADR